MRDWSASVWKQSSGQPTSTEHLVPAWNRTKPNGDIEEAILDVASSEPLSGTQVYMDVVVSEAHSVDPLRLRARARKDGKAAADASAEKHRRYPQAGRSLIPLAIEAGGKPSQSFINFIKKCGAGLAAEEANAADADAVFPRLWHEASTVLQIGNSELVLSALGV